MKNETTPSVSVVIPTYNRKEWISKAINSVKKQTYSAILEIIVVDDGSDDGTASLLETEFPEVLFLVNSQNEGACFSRNEGARVASGEYIAFLDSDDQFYENKIELQIDALLNANALLSTCAFKDSAGKNICRKNLSASSVNRILRYRNCLGGASSIIISKALFLDHGFNEEMKAAQDWEFLFRVTKSNSVIHLTTPLYYHETESNDRITDSQGSRQFGHAQLFEKHLKEFRVSRFVFVFLLGFLKNENKFKYNLHRKLYKTAMIILAQFE